MSFRLKLLTAVAVGVALVSVAGAASANTIQFTPGGAITSASLGRVTFETELGSVTCAMTLRGRLRTTAVSNTAGTNIGEITAVEMASCEGTSGINILNLSWQFLLGATWAGGNMSVTIHPFSFELLEAAAFGFIDCLYTGDASVSIATASGITALITSLANSIPRGGLSSIFCPSIARLRYVVSLSRQTVSTI